jgi:hypothetical protein
MCPAARATSPSLSGIWETHPCPHQTIVLNISFVIWIRILLCMNVGTINKDAVTTAKNHNYLYNTNWDSGHPCCDNPTSISKQTLRRSLHIYWCADLENNPFSLCVMNFYLSTTTGNDSSKDVYKGCAKKPSLHVLVGCQDTLLKHFTKWIYAVFA